jgi:recombinational DNA repair protein (RecF pathway)
MENGIKILGFTDSVNECDCCGKTGIKGTFAVSIEGNEFHYGSTCAHKKHGFSKAQVTKALTAFEDAKHAAKRKAYCDHLETLDFSEFQ